MRLMMLAAGVLCLQAGGARADEAPSDDVKQTGVGDEKQAGESDEPSAPAMKPPGEVEVPAPVAAVAPPRDAFATIDFRNDVGKKLRLIEARFTVDGRVTHTVVGPEPGKSYVVLSGSMKPGPHVVTTRLVYQGDRRVFSYMNGFKINVEADQVLVAPANRAVSFTIVGAEKGGLTVPLDRRLVVKVEEGAPRR